MTTEYPRPANPTRKTGQPERSLGHGHHPSFPIKIRFFDELKRRNVFRVAILYLIACWVILDPTHVVFHMLDVPEWANRLVIVLMAIGVPLVLLFSWVYEVTSEGLKPTAEVDPTKSITRRTGQKLNQAIMVSLALAVIVLLIDKFWFSGHSNTFESPPDASKKETGSPAGRSAANDPSSSKSLVVSDKSIAVLPFADMSERKDQEYFSDGLAEELIDKLSHSRDLKVIARTSSFQFKGRNEDTRAIAQKLGVQNLLEGSVRRDEKIVRITVQLIKANEGTSVWSQTYDRNLTNILKLQDEIALSVSQALEASLGPSGRISDLDAGETRNPRAMHAYLKGRLIDREPFTLERVQRAMSAYEEALRIDPYFARAAIGLARQHSFLAEQAPGTFTQLQMERNASRVAAEKALALAPSIGVAHSEYGVILINHFFEFSRGLEEIEKAIRLSPTDPEVIDAYGTNAFLFATSSQATEQAIDQLRRLVLLDPMNPLSWTSLADVLISAERPAEAFEAASRALRLNPEYSAGYALRGMAELALGRFAEAEHDCRHQPMFWGSWYCLVRVLDAMKRAPEADEALLQFQKQFGVASSYQYAEVYAFRNDEENAWHWLNEAIRIHDAGLIELRVDPAFKSLRDTERFRQIMKGMKFPHEERKRETMPES